MWTWWWTCLWGTDKVIVKNCHFRQNSAGKSCGAMGFQGVPGERQNVHFERTNTFLDNSDALNGGATAIGLGSKDFVPFMDEKLIFRDNTAGKSGRALSVDYSYLPRTRQTNGMHWESCCWGAVPQDCYRNPMHYYVAGIQDDEDPISQCCYWSMSLGYTEPVDRIVHSALHRQLEALWLFLLA